MIKALLMIFEPGATWDKVVLKKSTATSIFFGYLLPLLLLSVAVEVAGVSHFGRRDEISGNLVPMPNRLAELYAATQLVLSLVVVVVSAQVIKSFGDTFHSRHRFGQCLTLVAYTLGPVFIVRMLDAFPWMSPWASLAVGLVLSWGVLYQGIPRVLEPDPPHAFGLFLSGAVTISVVVGLARFVGLLVLWGRIKILK